MLLRWRSQAAAIRLGLKTIASNHLEYTLTGWCAHNTLSDNNWYSLVSTYNKYGWIFNGPALHRMMNIIY